MGHIGLQVACVLNNNGVVSSCRSLGEGELSTSDRGLSLSSPAERAHKVAVTLIRRVSVPCSGRRKKCRSSGASYVLSDK